MNKNRKEKFVFSKVYRINGNKRMKIKGLNIYNAEA